MSFLTAIYLMCGLSVLLAAGIAALLAWLSNRTNVDGRERSQHERPGIRHAS
jgi:hypothetical protein